MICCAEMQYYQTCDDIAFFYDNQRREYAIWCNHFESYYIIQHCPWCGKKLPKSLGDEFGSILVKEYNYDFSKPIVQEKLPIDFQTDAWWKKRKL